MLLRYLLTIALFAHGVGHLLFLANSWGYWKGDEGSTFFALVFDLAVIAVVLWQLRSGAVIS